MKIYGFYFIALMNDWKEIVDNQISTIISSELFSKTEKLFLYIYYENEEDLKYITEKFKDYVNVSILVGVTNEYEFPILKVIKDISRDDDFYCYYLHSKGVSITEKNMTTYNGAINLTHLKNCVNDWRKYMEYFIINRYEDSIKFLDEGFDSCGVNLTTKDLLSRPIPPHFSGNFWWSKSDYLKKLPEIDSLNLKNRFNAENWIGMGNGKLKCLYETKAGYHERINKNYLTYGF